MPTASFWAWLIDSWLDPSGLDQLEVDPNFWMSGQATQGQIGAVLFQAWVAMADDPDAMDRFWDELVGGGYVTGDANFYKQGKADLIQVKAAFASADAYYFDAGPGGTGTTPPPEDEPKPVPKPIDEEEPPEDITEPPEDPPPPATGPAETVVKIDFWDYTRRLFPWMSTDLVDLYAREWELTGDPALAMALVRASDAYAARFPGIRRPDGSLRMTEFEYMSSMEAYSTILTENGLNASMFSSRFVELMEGNVSPSEFAERVSSIVLGIEQNIPEVMAFYANVYGVEMTTAAILASVLDPTIGRNILNQTISIAQIGGEASAAGFNIGLDQATTLVNAGLRDQGAGRQLFTEAALRLPTYQTLATRFRDIDPDFNLTDFIDADFFNDAGQVRRIQRLLAGESASFSEQGFAASAGGKVPGLAQR